MNKRRAGNRAKAMRVGGGMGAMGGGMGGGSGRHMSWGSSASLGASKGAGSHPGAGELPAIGPGSAAKGYKSRDAGETPMASAPTGAAPKGMKVWTQE